MARPEQIANEDILAAARELFQLRGYHATTADIAERAGCSEATIFRRFPSKAKLFVAALGLPERPPWFDRVLPRVGADDLTEAFTQLADDILDFFEELIPRMIVMKASLHDPARLFKHLPERPPVVAITLVTRYLEAERRAGRIRTPDPEVVARAFLGALHHFAFLEFMGMNDELPMPRRTYVRVLVDHTLRGLGAHPAPEAA